MENITVELAVLRQHAEQRHPFILALECAFHSVAKVRSLPWRTYVAKLQLSCVSLYVLAVALCDRVRAGRHALQPFEEAGDVFRENGTFLRCGGTRRAYRVVICARISIHIF